MFPDLSGSNFNELQMNTPGAWARVIVKSKTGNLLNRATIEEVMSLNDIIVSITATADDGTEVMVRRLYYGK